MTASTLTIPEMFYSIFGNRHPYEELSSSQIKDMIQSAYPGTNRSSVIPPDYCYNRVNRGIPFRDHVFEYLGGNRYRVLGTNYDYEGIIYWREKHTNHDRPVGEWRKGDSVPHFWENVAK